MPLKAAEKENVCRYMLLHIGQDHKNYISKTVSAFGISKTTAYNYVKQMESDGLIEKSSETACRLKLSTTRRIFRYSAQTPLEEDRIFSGDIAPLIKELPGNVYEILRYIFTEMMNNAIEHSGAETISCVVEQNFLYSSFFIIDDGVGIFRKIQSYFESRGEGISLDEAVDALFPGKLTTAEKNHSGEGIFFSSRTADSFQIYSDGRIFTHDSFEDAAVEIQDGPLKKGTCVHFRLSNSSAKRLSDIFDQFADMERGFFKTQIPIAHMFSNGYPVSRSEARRLGTYIKKFEEVSLDFKNVPNVGQAFVHELFTVFHAENPDIVINVTNADENVSKMIARVKNTK